MTGGQTDDARAVIVTNADYRWCPGARIDDGKLVTGESDQPVLSGEDLFATVPHGTYLELDGSLTDLAGGIAKKLGPIQSVTYRYSTQKIQMLLPTPSPSLCLQIPWHRRRSRLMWLRWPATPFSAARSRFWSRSKGRPGCVDRGGWFMLKWSANRWPSAFRPRLTWRAAANEPKGSRGSQARVDHPAQRQEPALGHQGPEVPI